MKRVLIICCLYVAFVACDRKNYLSPEDCAEKNRAVAEEVKSLRAELNNKPEAQIFVVVNKSCVEPQWLVKELNEMTTVDGIVKITNKDAVTLETSTSYYVDLNLITKENNVIIRNWLSENDKCINFGESYWLIETSHKIQEKIDLMETEKLLNSDYTYQANWQEISNYINNGSLGQTTTNHFDKFIKIDLDNATHIQVVEKEDKSPSLFSFPLFNSIVHNHGLDGAAKFLFAKPKNSYRGGMVMKVLDKDDNLVGYYDFTHRPRYIVARSY